VHRDLKPGNILYKKEGNSVVWKVSDFGASIKNDNKLKTSVRKIMTKSYASIEHILEQDPLPAFDIWSSGIILYELMSGKLPYEITDNPAKMVKFIESTQPHPLP
jgi:eukaryotic-like serine/threonine-protein kinase